MYKQQLGFSKKVLFFDIAVEELLNPTPIPGIFSTSFPNLLKTVNSHFCLKNELLVLLSKIFRDF